VPLRLLRCVAAVPDARCAACAAGGAAFVQLFVRAQPQLASSRNAARAGAERVPAHVWDRLAAAFEPPDASVRGFEQTTVIVDVDENACVDDGAARVRDVWCRVRAAWGAAASVPPSAAELEARRACGTAGNARSSVHAWDVSTRRELSEALAQGASATAHAASSCPCCR
jgi:hypothetical protein